MAGAIDLAGKVSASRTAADRSGLSGSDAITAAFTGAEERSVRLRGDHQAGTVASRHHRSGRDQSANLSRQSSIRLGIAPASSAIIEHHHERIDLIFYCNAGFQD